MYRAREYVLVINVITMSCIIIGTFYKQCHDNVMYMTLYTLTCVIHRLRPVCNADNASFEHRATPRLLLYRALSPTTERAH